LKNQQQHRTLISLLITKRRRKRKEERSVEMGLHKNFINIKLLNIFLIVPTLPLAGGQRLNNLRGICTSL
jgi:hypothetical protein